MKDPKIKIVALYYFVKICKIVAIKLFVNYSKDVIDIIQKNLIEIIVILNAHAHVVYIK